MQRGTRPEYLRAALEQHLLAVSLKDAGMCLKQIGGTLGVTVARAAQVVSAGTRLKNAAAELERRIPTRRNAIGRNGQQGGAAP